MDADGLANVNYVYQWIVVDGGTETDIDGATASTYRLVAADQGKTITVRVSFADDVGTAQTLTSAATGTIQPSAATPAVTGVTVSSAPLRTSAGATSPDTYGMREHIGFTVQFHRAVTVIGTPTFTFMLVNSTRQATYYAGSETDTLRFSYAVSGGSSNVDADGISWQANAIALNRGTIVTSPDLTSTAATLEHDAAGNQPEHKVDGRIGVTLTTVVRVEPASTPELRSDTYPPGEVIRIAVTVSAGDGGGRPAAGFSPASRRSQADGLRPTTRPAAPPLCWCSAIRYWRRTRAPTSRSATTGRRGTSTPTTSSAQVRRRQTSTSPTQPSTHRRTTR